MKVYEGELRQRDAVSVVHTMNQEASMLQGIKTGMTLLATKDRGTSKDGGQQERERVIWRKELFSLFLRRDGWAPKGSDS